MDPGEDGVVVMMARCKVAGGRGQVGLVLKVGSPKDGIVQEGVSSHGEACTG